MPGQVCTSHVLRMHQDQALMTIAWYSQGVRVIDIAGLADYEPPAGAGEVAVAFGDGIGMTEIGSYVFPDANTWSFKTNKIGKDSSFYGYGNDLNRGMDVYRFVPGEDRPTTPLEPLDLLGGLATDASVGTTTDAAGPAGPSTELVNDGLSLGAASPLGAVSVIAVALAYRRWATHRS